MFFGLGYLNIEPKKELHWKVQVGSQNASTILESLSPEAYWTRSFEPRLRLPGDPSMMRSKHFDNKMATADHDYRLLNPGSHKGYASMVS